MEKQATQGTIKHFSNFKLKVLAQSLLIGLITGIVVVFYRILLGKVSNFREEMFVTLKSSPLIFTVAWFGLLLLAGYLLGILIEKFPMTKGSGIPQVQGLLVRKLKLNWLPELIGKFFGGIIGPGLGLSLGREGPSVQLGAEIGLGVSKIFKRHDLEEKYLVTSGASAGLSAAFNAPLAGVVFSLEELHRNFTPVILLCVMASSLVADFISKTFLGTNPAFAFAEMKTIPLDKYFHLIILGIIAGVMGAIFNYSILKAQDSYKSVKKIKTRYKAMFPFLLVGILGFILPDMLGGGHALVEKLNTQSFTISILLLFIVVKLVFTAICYGSGVPGGIFLPLLVIGALIGKTYGVIATDYFGTPEAYTVNFTILAMAAYFTAITRAPITGSILILEMTNSFDHLLGLIVVAIVAYVVVDLLNVKSIYDYLLERMLGEDEERNKREEKQTKKSQKKKKMRHKEKKIIMEIPIAMGSTIAGKRVKDISWPEHCLIIGIKRGESEILPKGVTEILQGDTLIILTDEEYASDVNYGLVLMGQEDIDLLI